MANDISKQDLELLLDGKLSWEEIERITKIFPKSMERFANFVKVLQVRVKFKERILVPLTDHLFVVAKEGGGRVVKCSCGQELGDYRSNWKISCLIYVRRGEEEIAKVYPTRPVAIDPDIYEVREYYCPGCAAQLGVEVCTRGYPPVFEALPDIDTFYRDWLGKPLPDEDKSWFEDRTSTVTAQWAKEMK